MLGAQIISSINVFSFSSNIIYLIRKTTYVNCRNVLKCYSTLALPFVPSNLSKKYTKTYKLIKPRTTMKGR